MTFFFLSFFPLFFFHRRSIAAGDPGGWQAYEKGYGGILGFSSLLGRVYQTLQLDQPLPKETYDWECLWWFDLILLHGLWMLAAF